MDHLILHKIALFLYNKNIDVVDEIFKNKVDQSMVDYLNQKAKGLKSTNDNASAWLKFILELDETNLKILYHFVTFSSSNR